jgi:hypothetical protein
LQIKGEFIRAFLVVLTHLEDSKSVRRDIKRIHADVEVVHRQKQSIMHALNESQKKLMALEHSRDIRVGFEIQLKELQEQMQTRIHECQVITTVCIGCSILTYVF